MTIEILEKLIEKYLEGWEPNNDYQDGFYDALKSVLNVIETGKWHEEE